MIGSSTAGSILYGIVMTGRVLQSGAFDVTLEVQPEIFYGDMTGNLAWRQSTEWPGSPGDSMCRVELRAGDSSEARMTVARRNQDLEQYA